MTISKLLLELRAKNIALSAVGDELVVRGTKQVLTGSVLAQLRENKQGLLDLIRAGQHGNPVLGNVVDPYSSQMLSLINLKQEEIDRIVERVPGGAGNVQDVYPLAPLQEGILFHHLMGERDPYILASQIAFANRGRLEDFLRALQAVVDRHDILRTGVLWEGLAEPVQVVWRKAELVVEEVDLGVEGGGNAAEQMYAHLGPQRHRMDVRQAPLLRLYTAWDEEKDRWLLMILQHHLMGDHSTLEAIVTEIQAYLLGQGERLPMPMPFRNLVAQARLGMRREEHEVYFREGDGDEAGRA